MLDIARPLRLGGVMESVLGVADVRIAEELAMASLPPDALMQRASTALSVFCAQVLRETNGKVTGSRVVVLAGSGNNGGDALWAGAFLARRGVSVTALLMSSSWHRESANALRQAGGRVEPIDLEVHTRLIDQADIVLDGILGIGGAGALRAVAAQAAAITAASSALTIAVDIPSGIDADTGAVADSSAVISADVTVTFGCLKPGLLVSPGAQHVGEVVLVDIGLETAGTGTTSIARVDGEDAADCLRRPGPSDNKYTRGVVGVVAGSPPYPGAAVLCTGSARLGGTGMVRYAGTAADVVRQHWPEVVLSHASVSQSGRVQAWVFGPGAGTDADAAQRLEETLVSQVPVVVIDADGLTLVAHDDHLRRLVVERSARGLITVVTPHAGEFVRLGFELGEGADADRIESVRRAAAALRCVVLLKGHETVVADPDGNVFINTCSDSALATAGSGDVLAGLVGSMMASEAAAIDSLTARDAAFVVACAAYVHGLAGVVAASDSQPVTAQDVLAALPKAIARVQLECETGHL